MTDQKRERLRASLRKYNRSEKGLAAKRKGNAKWRAKSKHIVSAENAILNEIRGGRLKQATEKLCSECGEQASQYHHPDYSKPLYAVAVCAPCHRQIHYNNKEK